jgi:hypothetical protein
MDVEAMMITFTCEDVEANQLMAILANSTGYAWTITNPLLMKLGEQMRQQQQLGQSTSPWPANQLRPNGPDETSALDADGVGMNPDRRVPRR